MKEKKFYLVLLLIFISAFLLAQKKGRGPKWDGSGGWGVNSQYQRLFNPNTIETLTGIVEKVETFTPFQGMNYGIHIILKTEKEKISVHLGPSWFIEKLDEKIEAGDKIEVKGSRVTINNSPSIIATEIKKGNSTLKLRDENGYPLWAGWRR